jgi:hypothetical protein
MLEINKFLGHLTQLSHLHLNLLYEIRKININNSIRFKTLSWLSK